VRAPAAAAATRVAYAFIVSCRQRLGRVQGRAIIPSEEPVKSHAPSATSSTVGDPLLRLAEAQHSRNLALLAQSPALGAEVRSRVLPLQIDLAASRLSDDTDRALGALEKIAATIAIESLISLAKADDIDHLGGGLELIGPLLMTLAAMDYEAKQFAIEHGHTSIGYYSALAALGFLPRDRVIDRFRRGLDIPGHVSWVPGGTPLGSGRLGVTVPVATGLALGLKAHHGAPALVVCHCGDAGWVSGQALNGFIAASLHKAPIVFVMHRNGIQLSGTTAHILDRDPRPIIASLGVEILEIPSLHDRQQLFTAYADAFRLAQEGRPVLIYPVGLKSTASAPITVQTFGARYGVAHETAHFAAEHGVALDTPIWIPGSLMSYRDTHAMLECLFYVNNLAGGEGHHDGGMKGRDGAQALAGAMLQRSADEERALDALRQRPPREVISRARPANGTANLVLDEDDLAGVMLPGPEKWVSARAGSEAAYAAIAKKHPSRCFFVSCDLNPSTKLGKAAAYLAADHRFEMSIQEQAASLLANGLSLSSHAPQLNVFATFTAFLEGIAREGFEYWRYQRDLDGPNDGLNVLMHLAHVGACTGRDHFSGWSLDWVNLALGYLPFLRRFYAPADARAAFVAVRDAAAGMGGHIVAIPRDTLPILTKAGTAEPLWNARDRWTPVTVAREQRDATTAILALGAPSYLALAASDKATAQGVATDVYIVNGFPLPADFWSSLSTRYRRLFTIEDGLIGTPGAGLRGFAAFAAGAVRHAGVSVEHFGIVDPQVAPSDHFFEVWKHFGMTEDDLIASLVRSA
jgi:transketolase N-terminal domain/subunit/transketolase C-terminal domain/subunit